MENVTATVGRHLFSCILSNDVPDESLPFLLFSFVFMKLVLLHCGLRSRSWSSSSGSLLPEGHVVYHRFPQCIMSEHCLLAYVIFKW